MQLTKLNSDKLKTAVSAVLFISVSVAFSQSLHAAVSQDQIIWESAYQNQQSGDAQACFQNLSRLEHLTGDITYDRLLGLCAQAAGENSQALLAYNRILAQQEQNAEIRLERARVLFNMSLYSEAQQEFLWLLSKNPPEAAKNTIIQYLRVIKERKPKVVTYTRLKVSTSLGYDDNVNSASELDDFLGFTLNETSRATSSSYAGLAVQAEHMYKLSYDSGLKISTSLSSKHFPDADFVDQDFAVLGLGYVKLFETSSINVNLINYQQRVDSQFNSRGSALNASYSKKINPNLSISPYLRAAALRYADNIQARNVNQYVFGARASYVLDNSQTNILDLDIHFGHDYPIFQNSNFEADLSSIRFSYRHLFNTNLYSTANLQYTAYEYEQPFFVNAFPDNRDDRRLSAQFKLDWQVTDKFKLSPTVQYRDVSSNVDIFSYQRWFAELNASYQWLW